MDNRMSVFAAPVSDPEYPIYSVEADFTKLLKAEAILVAPALAAD